MDYFLHVVDFNIRFSGTFILCCHYCRVFLEKDHDLCTKS